MSSGEFSQSEHYDGSAETLAQNIGRLGESLLLVLDATQTQTDTETYEDGHVVTIISSEQLLPSGEIINLELAMPEQENPESDNPSHHNLLGIERERTYVNPFGGTLQYYQLYRFDLTEMDLRDDSLLDPSRSIKPHYSEEFWINDEEVMPWTVHADNPTTINDDSLTGLRIEEITDETADSDLSELITLLSTTELHEWCPVAERIEHKPPKTKKPWDQDRYAWGFLGMSATVVYVSLQNYEPMAIAQGAAALFALNAVIRHFTPEIPES